MDIQLLVKKEQIMFFLEDYGKLLRIIENQQSKMEDTKKFVKVLYDGGYITEATKNNILERLKDSDD